MPTGFTTITATRIQDASGELLATGRVTFYPVNSSGAPVSAIAGGGGGTILQSGVTFLVVGGAITTDLYGRTPQVADTTETTPINIAYRVTITDASGVDVQGPGYGLVQPSGATWSLDTYVPIQPVGITIQPGPPGPPGSVGVVLVNAATSVPYTVVLLGGRLEVVPTAPVLIDSVTAQQYAMEVVSDSGGVSRLVFTPVSGVANAVASIQIADGITGAIRTLTLASGRPVVT